MATQLSRDDLPGLLASILLVNVVGSVPALVGGPNSPWFRALEKPALYPPPWLFGVVWPVLFTLMGVALYLVWRNGTDDSRVRVAVGLFAVQMAVNVAWTPAFFALERLLVAFGIVVVLFVLVAATIWAFDRVERRAALLLVPYLCWVGFATVLNYEFWRVNL